MIISVIGPHAVGKTTAFEDYLIPWAKQFPRKVHIVNCDNSLERYWNDGDLIEYKNKNWQAKADEKQKTYEACASSDDIFVCETAWADHIRFAGELKIPSQAILIIASPSPEVMQLFIQERCELKGKTFRDDYWTLKKCKYEAKQRYLNAIQKYVDRKQTKVLEWPVGSDRHQWPFICDTIKDLVQLLLGMDEYKDGDMSSQATYTDKVMAGQLDGVTAYIRYLLSTEDSNIDALILASEEIEDRADLELILEYFDEVSKLLKGASDE